MLVPTNLSLEDLMPLNKLFLIYSNKIKKSKPYMSAIKLLDPTSIDILRS